MALSVPRSIGVKKGAIKCPASHPNPYLYGNFCCRTRRERQSNCNVCRPTPQREIDTGDCDGVGFDIFSRCCNNEEYIRCPGVQCLTDPSG